MDISMSNATLWLPYAQMQTTLAPFEVVKTHNARLKLADGSEIIDGIASWWTACHGYNHPHIVKAIQEQAAILPHIMMGGLVHPQATRLATRLAALLPGTLDYVFFSESGSVAVEIAMKMALQFWMNHRRSEKHRFIFFEHGYHGDTFFTMSVCDPYEGMHQLFHKVLPTQYYQKLPTNESLLECFETWLKAHAHECAGLLIEPLVQGAGGMKMHSPQTLQAIAKLCQQYEVLLIVDEIFTGFGRTGSLFAIEQANIIPDIICLSKALTGGTLPLAATIATQWVYKAFLDENPQKALMHGTTFMGNALGCAAANASLDLFVSEPRLAQAAEISATLLQAFAPLLGKPGILDVRVLGAIGAIQLARPLTSIEMNWFKQQAVAQGIWYRPIKDVVYITPALTIGQADLIKITQTIVQQVLAWSTLFYHA